MLEACVSSLCQQLVTVVCVSSLSQKLVPAACLSCSCQQFLLDGIEMTGLRSGRTKHSALLRSVILRYQYV